MAEAEIRNDKMGRLHNKVVSLMNKSNLSVAEMCLVLDNIKLGLLINFKRETGQE